MTGKLYNDIFLVWQLGFLIIKYNYGIQLNSNHSEILLVTKTEFHLFLGIIIYYQAEVEIQIL